MAEARLARLFWEALDHAAYLLTDARLWLFDLIHSPEPPTYADGRREADRKRPEALPIIDFGAFMAAADKLRTQSTPDADTPLTASGACSPRFSPSAHQPSP